MEIVKGPHLEQLRTDVSELKRLVDGEPNFKVVTDAWAMVTRIKQALAELCPNHHEVFHQLR